MAENDTCETCGTSDETCCSLEAVVSVDERGQLVLPKDLRTRAGIAAGDRFALVSYRGEDGAICCITLVKTDAVAGAVRSVIAPALGLDT
jgi:antitoxin PrlF